MEFSTNGGAGAGLEPETTNQGEAVVIRQVRYDSVVAQALIADALADLGARYGGPGDETPVDPEEFVPPHGAILVAYLDHQPVACGGWRTFAGDPTVAELKRMYTRPQARRRGVARRVLAAVEESARSHGRHRMILECGQRQPEAISLYLAAGYHRIPDFGYYRGSPEVVSLGRDL